MKKSIVHLFTVLLFSSNAICQSYDTVAARVITITNLKKCLLIKIVSFCNQGDTSVIISEKKKNNQEKGKVKIKLDQQYIFVKEKDIVLASPPKRMSVKFKDTIIWTNNEPYKLKPQICINCNGWDVIY